MILDLRTYTFHPGKLAEFLPVFEREGLPVQSKYCGHLVGYFTAESGMLNQAVQLWAYKDSNDRDERRAALWRDPAFAVLGEKLLPLIQAQENKLLRPTAFSPLR